MSKKEIIPDYIKKIIFVRMDALGDAILTTPMLKAFRDGFPDAVLTVLCTPYTLPVYESLGFIDSIKTLNMKELAPLERLDTLKKMFSDYYDLTLVASPTTWSYISCKYTLSPHRVGVVYEDRPLVLLGVRLLNVLTDIIPVNPRAKLLSGEKVPHEVEQCFKLAEAAKVKPRTDRLILNPGKEAESFAYNLFAKWHWFGNKKIFCIHLSEKWINHGWDKHYFNRLVHDLQKQYPECGIIFTYGPGETEMGREMEFTFKKKTEIKFGKNLSVLQWAAIVKKCNVMITHDTAAIHVASSQNTPVLAVYAGEDYEINSQKFAPWKAPHKTFKQGNPLRLIQDLVKAAGEVRKTYL